jgi:rhamnulokinase
VLDAIGIPSHLFHSVTESGSVIGTLRPAVADETQAGEIPVVLPACHDTGSAVAAVPAQNQDFAWISSGTWSIMGAEVLKPIVNEKALEYNFTNEGGVFGTWRFSKNITGLWLVQECRRTWQHQGEDLTYDEITQLASKAKPFLAVIDPDDGLFLHPGNMPERIQKYCADTNQTVPQTKGEIVRVVLECMALKYLWVLERLEELSRKHYEPIHIIGGGTKNRLLNQFTADCTQRKVIAGPVEATAIGNILLQAIALGHLASLSEARALIRSSFAPEVYEPNSIAGWDEAYARLQKVMK